MLFLGGTLSVLGAVFLTVRHMRNLLADTSQAVEAIASGDLTQEVHQFGQDELGEMTKKMVVMRNNLIDIIRILLRDVDTLRVAASELSAFASRNASDANEQLKTTQEADASIKNLRLSVEKIENFVALAGDVTRQSGEMSEQGGKIISHSSTEMQLIANAVNEMAAMVNELDGHSQSHIRHYRCY